MKEINKFSVTLGRSETKDLLKLAVDFEMKPTEAISFLVVEGLKKYRALGYSASIKDFEYHSDGEENMEKLSERAEGGTSFEEHW